MCLHSLSFLCIFPSSTLSPSVSIILQQPLNAWGTCSISLELFCEQQICKNNSFPVASSKLDLSLELKYSTAHQPNCWKVVTVFGWRYFLRITSCLCTHSHTYSHNHTRTRTHRKETQWIESYYASIFSLWELWGILFCMFFSLYL